MWRKLALDPRELNLAAVLRCGQSFRWAQIGDVWSICLQNRVLFVKQDASHLYYRSEGPGTKVSDTDLVRDYFNLDIEVMKLYQKWMACDSKHFETAHFGVRILRQDPWETLCAFICSSNNNIKRISKMVQSLCTEFGPHVATVDGIAYHDFPTPQELASSETESRLRELGFGYRAKYISRTAEVLSKKPANYLWELRTADTETAVNALLEFAGVGPKVADCVSLMSLDKHEVVPIDTHMYQIASRDYKLKVTLGARGYKDVQNKLKEIWGEHAGWAHSVLFAGDLPSLDSIKREHNEIAHVNHEQGEHVKQEHNEIAIKYENSGIEHSENTLSGIKHSEIKHSEIKVDVKTKRVKVEA